MKLEVSRRNLLLGAGATLPGEGLVGAVSVADFLDSATLADSAATRPSRDASAAFAAAWDAVRQTGGVLVIPPGNYLLTQPWRCEVTHPAHIKVSGWGAKLFAGPGVERAAVEIVGAFNEYLLDIEGLAFDHRGNGRVGGCVAVSGGHCVTIRRCSLEYWGVRAGYEFVAFGPRAEAPSASGERDDRQSFWCKVEGCTIRRRSGDESGSVGVFAKVVGAANALTLIDNCIQHCDIGVSFEPDPVTKSIANAAMVERNFFENVTRSAIRVTVADGGYGPSGLRIFHNRFERCPTAFELVARGESRIHSQPPFLFGNYYTAGSVDQAVRNPSGYPVSALETRYPGFGPTIDNDLYMSGSMRMRFAESEHLHLSGYDGSGNWDRGRLYFGSDWSIWVDRSAAGPLIRQGDPDAQGSGRAL